MHNGSNSANDYSLILVRLLAAVCVTLAGCVGPPLLMHALPLETSKPLAEARDERIRASIDLVILRNGPGAWAFNADWDEYLIRIRALSDEPVEIREVAIFDAFDRRIEACPERSDLLDGTRKIEQYYKQSGQLVRAPGGHGWIAAGAGVTSVAGLVTCKAPAGIGGMATITAAASAVADVGLVIARSAVIWTLVANSEIKRRQTALPVALPRGTETKVDLFFPITPLSGRTQVVYADRHGEYRLDIDTRQALIDLDPPPTIVTRREAKFPDHAREAAIKQGYVTAQLTLDPKGQVKGVNVIESVPRGVFDDQARRTFQGWTYSKSRFNLRVVEATLEFTR